MESNELLNELRLVREELRDLKAANARILDSLYRIESANPLDLKNELWNWKTKPFTTSAERWVGLGRFLQLVRNRLAAVAIDPQTVMCRVLGTYWIFFKRGNGLLTDRLVTEGLWELSVTEVIAHETEPGMTVVDIGANVGYYSLLMAHLVGPTGKLYVCEAAPHLQAGLRRSIEVNFFDDRTRFVFQPFYDRSGETIRFAIPQDDKNGRIVDDRDGAEGMAVVELTTTTLDDVFPPGSKVDVVKVDVEGAEEPVWRGMRRVIQDNPNICVILEFNAGRMVAPRAFLEDAVALGFPLRYIDDLRGVQPIDMDSLCTTRVGWDWMLYLRRG